MSALFKLFFWISLLTVTAMSGNVWALFAIALSLLVGQYALACEGVALLEPRFKGRAKRLKKILTYLYHGLLIVGVTILVVGLLSK